MQLGEPSGVPPRPSPLLNAFTSSLPNLEFVWVDWHGVSWQWGNISGLRFVGLQTFEIWTRRCAYNKTFFRPDGKKMSIFSHSNAYNNQAMPLLPPWFWSIQIMISIMICILQSEPKDPWKYFLPCVYTTHITFLMQFKTFKCDEIQEAELCSRQVTYF